MNQHEKEIDDFVNSHVECQIAGYGESYCRKECWRFAMRQYGTILTLEAVIDRAMELYGEIIKRSLTSQNQ